MPPLSRSLLALVALGLPGVALAQEAPAPAPFNAQNQNYLPNDGDPRDPLTLRRPGRFVAGDWYTGMTWEFADSLATETFGPDDTRIILDNVLGVHLGAGVAVHDRVRVDLAMPLYLVSITETNQDTSQAITSSQGLGAGDLRVNATLALIRPEDTSLGGGFGLALNPWLDAPVGTDDQYFSHPGWGGGGTLAATYETETMTYTAEAGLAAFPRELPGEFGIGDNLVAGVGVGYLVDEHWGVNVEYKLGPTLAVTEQLGDGTPMELWGTTRRRFDDGGHMLGGIAVGLNDASGTASWRAVVGGGFGKWDDPTPPDADGDGLHDKIDQCIDKPETVNEYKDDDGCPDQLSTVKLFSTYRGKNAAGVDITLTTPAGDQALKSGAKPIEFQAMPELELKATAKARGCLVGEATVTTKEGATDFEIPLTIDNPQKVAFSVKNEDGEAVKGAAIRFNNAGKRVACAPVEAVNTDDAGAANAEAAPGKHRFVVKAPGYAIATGDLDTEELGEGTVEVVLKSTKIKLTDKKIEILEKVFFETGKDVIKDQSYGLLDEIATTLNANPKIAKVEIQGHTDDRGRDSANLALSQGRADAVVKYLVGKGVKEDRLVAKGYGEAKPVESNKTSAGRAANRRVEFQILSQGGGAEKKVLDDKKPEKKVLGDEAKPEKKPLEEKKAPEKKVLDKKE